MQTLRRFVAPVTLSAVLAACPGARSASNTPGSTTSPTAAVTSSAPAGAGAYLYQNAGLTATLDLDAGGGTLEIRNETGRELAAPSFYLLDARDGRRVPGTVEAAAPTPDGQTSTFNVSFSELEVRNIGLAVLVIGHDNYGAFVRQ